MTNPAGSYTGAYTGYPQPFNAMAGGPEQTGSAEATLPSSPQPLQEPLTWQQSIEIRASAMLNKFLGSCTDVPHFIKEILPSLAKSRLREAGMEERELSFEKSCEIWALLHSLPEAPASLETVANLTKIAAGQIETIIDRQQKEEAQKARAFVAQRQADLLDLAARGWLTSQDVQDGQQRISASMHLNPAPIATAMRIKWVMLQASHQL